MSAVVPLRVQFRETIRGDGTVHEDRLAFCCGTEGWVSLTRCRTCDSCEELSGDARPFLLCKASVAPPPSPPSVRAMLARAVWCIDEGAPAHLVRLVPATQADAIVVDRRGHAIGTLSRESVRRAPPNAAVRAVMEPSVVALFDGAPAARARELLLERGVRTLPVLSAGRVVGCIDARATGTGS